METFTSAGDDPVTRALQEEVNHTVADLIVAPHVRWLDLPVEVRYGRFMVTAERYGEGWIVNAYTRRP